MIAGEMKDVIFKSRQQWAPINDRAPPPMFSASSARGGANTSWGQDGVVTELEADWPSFSTLILFGPIFHAEARGETTPTPRLSHAPAVPLVMSHSALTWQLHSAKSVAVELLA